MKKYSLILCLSLSLFLYHTASVSLAAPAVDSLLADMNGKWQVEDKNLPESLFMIIDVENKTVTVSNNSVSKSDKFTVGFEEGNSIVLIAREHREAMYFEFRDRDTMITKTDENTAHKTLKRVK